MVRCGPNTFVCLMLAKKNKLTFSDKTPNNDETQLDAVEESTKTTSTTTKFTTFIFIFFENLSYNQCKIGFKISYISTFIKYLRICVISMN